MRFLLHICFIAVLTIITQIGGIIYLIAILVIRKSSRLTTIKRLSFFVFLYSIATFFIVPYLAPVFGREKIRDTEFLRAHSLLFKLTNRNYVVPELNQSLEQIANDFSKQHNGICLVYLDANFPFIKGFPLFPHLSHNDGKKIDVSFIYSDTNKLLTNKKPSLSGYGIYESPKPNEYDQIAICKQGGNWQYDWSKYLTFGTINSQIIFSEKGTRDLVNTITTKPEIGKLFIEPHLNSRLDLTHSKIRFHGCQAVRHDDHIHFQLK